MSLFKRLFFVATASKHGMQRNLYLRTFLESSLERFFRLKSNYLRWGLGPSIVVVVTKIILYLN